MPSETRRRVDVPRIFEVPGVIARTKRLTRPPFCSSSSFVGLNLKETQPLFDVRCVPPDVMIFSGRLRMKTSALRTSRPRESTMR
jgi:hypothetical protein